MNVLAVLIFSAVLATVLCNSTGPPMGACVTLTPGHAPSTDSGASPYEVIITPTMYGPGDDISVTVQKIGGGGATPDFRGIIVQARPKSGGTTPLGTFSSPSTGTKLMMCTTADSTWSHADPSDKTTATATWTAPMAANQDMVFVATVVQRNDGTSTYYEGLMSADLTYNGPTAGPMPTGMTAGAGDMTTIKADAGYLRASLICTGLALFAIALVGRRL